MLKLITFNLNKGSGPGILGTFAAGGSVWPGGGGLLVRSGLCHPGLCHQKGNEQERVN